MTYIWKRAYEDMYNQVLDLDLMQSPPTYDEFVNQELMNRTKIK